MTTKTERIIEDHTRKSKQLREMKQKLKYSISAGYLRKLLAREEKFDLDIDHYRYNDDDDAFIRDEAAKKARIKLLKELIEEAERSSWIYKIKKRR